MPAGVLFLLVYLKIQKHTYTINQEDTKQTEDVNKHMLNRQLYTDLKSTTLENVSSLIDSYKLLTITA